jgi:hypothetical protein
VDGQSDDVVELRWSAAGRRAYLSCPFTKCGTRQPRRGFQLGVLPGPRCAPNPTTRTTWPVTLPSHVARGSNGGSGARSPMGFHKPPPYSPVGAFRAWASRYPPRDLVSLLARARSCSRLRRTRLSTAAFGDKRLPGLPAVCTCRPYEITLLLRTSVAFLGLMLERRAFKTGLCAAGFGMVALNPLIWGATGWAVFFISCFFVGAGMMYTAFFLWQYFREWRERREAKCDAPSALGPLLVRNIGWAGAGAGLGWRHKVSGFFSEALERGVSTLTSALTVATRGWSSFGDVTYYVAM